MLKKIGVGLVVVFLGLQFFNPEKNESTEVLYTDFILVEKPNTAMSGVLKTACYDCHSNHTIYPWYDRITPVNFWVQGHVDHGKGHLNFSIWDTYSPKKKAHKLEECIEMVEEGEMPLSSYTITHSEARLTEEQKKELINWLEMLRIKYETTNLPM